MKKCVIILCGFLSFGNNLIIAQSKVSSFTLKGTINIDTGKVELIPVTDSLYYSFEVPYTEAEIVNGKFTFTGKISFPYAFQILLKTSGNYISGVFYLDSGKQIISCNADSLRETPAIANNSMREFISNYLPEYSSIRNKYDDYDERTTAISKFLLNYIKLHPESYVALWQIAIELKKGYAASLDSAFNQMSNSIKYCYTGKILGEKLKEAKLVAIGRQFPKLRLYTIQGKKITIPESDNFSEYTLIDFWYSHCPPCLKQLADFKELYKSFKKHGLEIIGISTDFKKDIPAWKRVIRDTALSWPQYLDMNGMVSQKLGIALFPSNFLLDSTGKIIVKNIEPDQLESFLRKNLHLP